MVRAIVVVGVCALVSGCGVAAKVTARDEYQSSSAAYKECLVTNPAAPQKCEGYRLAMETDERKFNNMAAGMTPGATQARNLNVLNR